MEDEVDRLRAAILCPGPSLRLTLPKEWDFDRVVGVTDGVLADAPITHWCFQEGPGHKTQDRFARYAERIFELKPKIWCTHSSRDRWVSSWSVPDEWLDDSETITSILEGLPYEPRAWTSPKRTSWRPYAQTSGFFALARCIKEGFKEIHVFGMDMKGNGNFDPRSGKIEYNKRVPEWWMDRWTWERALLPLVVKEAKRHDIDIVIHEKEVDTEAYDKEVHADFYADSCL